LLPQLNVSTPKRASREDGYNSVSFDYTNEARGLVAICEGSNGTGEVALADLAFPPDTVTAWIHAAYRHYLGLQPFPARPHPDWTWPD
jgi:hypothetical protein